eukprot:5815680-Pleurochrysis_carterae.AAC.1
MRGLGEKKRQRTEERWERAEAAERKRAEEKSKRMQEEYERADEAERNLTKEYREERDARWCREAEEMKREKDLQNARVAEGLGMSVDALMEIMYRINTAKTIYQMLDFIPGTPKGEVMSKYDKVRNILRKVDDGGMGCTMHKRDELSFMFDSYLKKERYGGGNERNTGVLRTPEELEYDEKHNKEGTGVGKREQEHERVARERKDAEYRKRAAEERKRAEEEERKRAEEEIVPVQQERKRADAGDRVREQKITPPTINEEGETALRLPEAKKPKRSLPPP